MLKATYGTGCFALLNTGATPVASNNKLLTTVAYQLGGERTFALEGSIFVAGAAVQWLRDGLHLVQDAAETGRTGAPPPIPPRTSSWCQRSSGWARPIGARRARRAVRPDPGHRPARTRAAPRWRACASRPPICCPPCGPTGAQAATRRTVLRVDGGMATSDWTMQRLACLLDAPVDRPQIAKPRHSAPPISPACTPAFFPRPTASPNVGAYTAASCRRWTQRPGSKNSPAGKRRCDDCWRESGG